MRFALYHNKSSILFLFFDFNNFRHTLRKAFFFIFSLFS